LIWPSHWFPSQNTHLYTLWQFTIFEICGNYGFFAEYPRKIPWLAICKTARPLEGLPSQSLGAGKHHRLRQWRAFSVAGGGFLEGPVMGEIHRVRRKVLRLYYHLYSIVLIEWASARVPPTPPSVETTLAGLIEGWQTAGLNAKKKLLMGPWCLGLRGWGCQKGIWRV